VIRLNAGAVANVCKSSMVSWLHLRASANANIGCARFASSGRARLLFRPPWNAHGTGSVDPRTRHSIDRFGSPAVSAASHTLTKTGQSGPRESFTEQMPRYYFGYGNGAPETQGEELADDDAARDVAAVMSEELGRNLAVCPKITIFDEAGEIVATGSGDIELPKTH
jgi:hypothetical protein